MNNILIILLIFCPLSSYGQNILSDTKTIKTAKMLETKGDIEGAISIYENILTRKPKHRQSIQNLKNIFLKYLMYDRGIAFMRHRMTKEPNDVRTYCELGEMYFLNNQKKEATLTWYAGLNKFKHNRSFYRIMLSTLAKHNLDDELSTVIKKGRDNFGGSFLSFELGTYLQSIGKFDTAMDEFISHLLNEKSYQGIIERKILLMSDDEEAIQIIEDKLFEASQLYPNQTLNMLSEFYFKQQQYDLSIQTKKEWTNKGNKDFNEWIKFANDLRSEGQYQYAIDAYYFVLSYKLNSRLTERALLGLGKTFDDQITTKKTMFLIPYFYDNNMFFKDPFQVYSSISTKHLESSLNLYDSLLVSLKKPSFLSEAYYRLGDIQYRILQDFDKAYYLLNKSMNYKPGKKTKLKIINKTSDVLIAMGQTREALSFLQKQQKIEPLKTINEKIILIQFLTNSPDSILYNIELSLNNLELSDPSFNDLMELKNLIAKYYSEPSDYSSFKYFQKSELFIRQKKLGDALKELEYLVESFPESPITSLAHLRLAMIHFRLENFTNALSYALLLDDTEFADKGIILTGQIYEIQEKNIEISLEQYMKILNDFTYSIYYEPIRYHVRKIQKTKS
ncbi:MAG: tetratricopeptide repeat protein [Candidatus Neomarinimicrobiota bacterium]